MTPRAELKRMSDARLTEIRRQSLERQTGLSWIAEHQFCDGRRWRFDFACLEIATAIEIDGGVTVETAPLVAAAGADVLVAGSAVFKGGSVSDPAPYGANIRAIRAAAEKAL